jgi:hypothetical protein
LPTVEKAHRETDWTVLARHLRTPTDYAQFAANQRMSNVSSNSRSSNASSLFSPPHPRNSTASWSTKYSHDSTLGTPTREPSEMPFVDQASPMEITHDFTGYHYDSTQPQMQTTFMDASPQPMSAQPMSAPPTVDMVCMYDRQPSIISMPQSDDLNATLRRPIKPTRPSREKSYFCTSCDQDFARKWDWKHHEEEFHERSRKWVCQDCSRDFYAENSFKKHHERSHQCKKCPHARKAMVPQEQRVAWGCGICKALLRSWDERIEHVATHYEEGKTKKDWAHSKVVYGLLHQEDIISRWRTFVSLRHGRDGLSFSWDKKIIKDALRGLEYKRETRDLDDLVKSAYELGICDNTSQSQLQRRTSQNKPLPSLPSENEKTEQVLASPSTESPPTSLHDSMHMQEDVRQTIRPQPQGSQPNPYFAKVEPHDSVIGPDQFAALSPSHNFSHPTPYGQQQSFDFVPDNGHTTFMMPASIEHTGQAGQNQQSWLM